MAEYNIVTAPGASSIKLLKSNVIIEVIAKELITFLNDEDKAIIMYVSERTPYRFTLNGNPDNFLIDGADQATTEDALWALINVLG